MPKPIHEIRFGLIRARIFLNQTRSGPRHNTHIVRLYRDGDVWRESTIYGREDLPLVCKAADLAHTWIFEHIQHERAEVVSTGASEANERETPSQG